MRDTYTNGDLRVFFAISGNEEGEKPSLKDGQKWDRISGWNEYGMTLVDPRQKVISGLWGEFGVHGSMVLEPGFVIHKLKFPIREATQWIESAMAAKTSP